LGCSTDSWRIVETRINVRQATVAKYMGRRRQPPSQTWRTFLRNHLGQIVAADFFVVPTVTYRLLFVLVLLAHDRRRIRHIAVTAHPTAAWTAQQLREAFPWDEAPRYLLHDRDHAFDGLEATAKAMGIEEVLTAPRAPWQNAFVERFIGSARRECFDQVIVFNEAGLPRLMTRYCSYYERSRTHCRSTKTRQFLVRSRRRRTGPSSRSRKWVVATIATSDARPERAYVADSTRGSPNRSPSTVGSYERCPAFPDAGDRLFLPQRQNASSQG
jgi:transposase InsO family protein